MREVELGDGGGVPSRGAFNAAEAGGAPNPQNDCARCSLGDAVAEESRMDGPVCNELSIYSTSPACDRSVLLVAFMRQS